MFKKSLALLATVFLLACQNTSTDTEVEEVEAETPEEYTYASEIDPSEVLILSSSELVDNTGYGFTYVANNVIDQDYSTAWCHSSDDEIKAWSIHFNDTVIPGNVGILAGFGRDGEIFDQNNRVKTFNIRYDGQEMGSIELEDTYSMQFPELPQEPVSQIDFYIAEVYEGSKYDDTCIAEVDFWSDYVLEENSYEAYSYYLENKASEAIRPVGIREVSMTMEDGLLACGAVDTNSYFEQKSSDGSIAFHSVDGSYDYMYSNYGDGTWIWNFSGGGDLALSALMNDEVSTDDEITIRWWNGDPVSVEDMSVREWKIEAEQTAYPQECSDGNLYIGVSRPDSVAGTPFTKFKVEILFGEKVIGSAQYGFVQ